MAFCVVRTLLPDNEFVVFRHREARLHDRFIGLAFTEYCCQDKMALFNARLRDAGVG